MRILYILPIFVFLCSCNALNPKEEPVNGGSKEHPTVTIETSGDLYYEEGGGPNIQMDLFGSCAHGQSQIVVKVSNMKKIINCEEGRYRYSLNLSPQFFSENQASRMPSSKYVMKEVTAFHEGHEKLKATSYILIDRHKKEIRSVINKHVRFERIPTGEFEPVTFYNAFGSCAPNTIVKIDIKSPDRYGHLRSKFDEVKKCQSSGGFYFVSQIDGFSRKGTLFEVYVDRPYKSKGRVPASKKKLRYKNEMHWKVPPWNARSWHYHEARS